MKINKISSLILTNSGDVTADYLCHKLSEASVKFYRLNTDTPLDNLHIDYSLKCQCLVHNGITINPDSISNIIVRRPKPLELPDIQDLHTRSHCILEWSEAFEGFLAHIDMVKWINHPANNAVASHKLHQLSKASFFGLLLPETLFTNSPDNAKKFYNNNSNGVIVKPLASGYIEREEQQKDTLIYTNEFMENHLQILDKIRSCPVLFQKKINKSFDVRVTVLDRFVSAIAIKADEDNSDQQIDIRRNNMSNVSYKNIEMPSRTKEALLKLLDFFSLRFAAADFVVSESGEWYFLEINPNGQWAWLDLEANASIYTSFIEALT